MLDCSYMTPKTLEIYLAPSRRARIAAKNAPSPVMTSAMYAHIARRIRIGAMGPADSGQYHCIDGQVLVDTGPNGRLRARMQFTA